MGIDIKIADRLTKLPPYLFVEIDRAKAKALEQGRDIIDLGVGDPDLPTPKPIIDKMYEALQNPKHHQYPSNKGLASFREAIKRWYKKRFNVNLNPDTEILPLIGSKEGIAHFPFAFINPGDIALVPDPCYPPYKGGTILAGGFPYLMPLLEHNDFLPNLDVIDSQIASRAKIMFLNYPNNPTTSTASVDYYENTINFAKKNNIIIAHDAAYSEIYYNDYKPVSFMEIQGAKDAGVEFHSLSKTFNMTGWRIGFVVGNEKIITALAKVKSNIDSGVFQAVQEAAISALDDLDQETEKIRQIYQQRKKVMIDGFAGMNWKIEEPMATFYLWIKVPSGYTSTEITKLFLEKADIVVTPGIGFGKNGEGYFRIALTVSKERLAEAVNRIERLKF